MHKDSRTLCFVCGTPFFCTVKGEDDRNHYDAYSEDDLSEEDLNWSKRILKLRFESLDQVNQNGEKEVAVVATPLGDFVNAWPFNFKASKLVKVDARKIGDNGIEELDPSVYFDLEVHHYKNLEENAYVFHEECLVVLKKQVEYHLRNFQVDGQDQSILNEILFKDNLARMIWNQQNLDEYFGTLWEHDYGGTLECLEQGSWDGWECPEYGSNPLLCNFISRMLQHPPLVTLPLDIAYPPTPFSERPISISNTTDLFAKIPLEVLHEIIYKCELDFKSVLSLRQASKYLASKLPLNYQHRCLGRFLASVPWVWELTNGSIGIGHLLRKIETLRSSSNQNIIDWRVLRVEFTWINDHRKNKEETQLFKETTPTDLDPFTPSTSKFMGLRNRGRIWNCNNSLAYILAQLQFRNGVCNGIAFESRASTNTHGEIFLKLIKKENDLSESPILAELPFSKTVEEGKIVTLNSYPHILYRSMRLLSSTGYTQSRLVFLPEGPLESMTIYFTGLPCSLRANEKEDIQTVASDFASDSITTFGTIPPWNDEDEDDSELQAAADEAELADDGASRYVSGLIIEPGNVKLGYVPTYPAAYKGSESESEVFSFEEGEKLVGFNIASTHRGIKSLQVLTDKRQSEKMGETSTIYSTRKWRSTVSWRLVREYTISLDGTQDAATTIKGLHANFDVHRMASLGLFGETRL
ncbi:hypothetical protein H072_3076 [Dactylellina haptotyla CBS 200.50]|uniref:DUF7600 domain-containing protein n=1 Tax=Dactylellina haptotyla (strain CBS 200.50) TaxID=1284197 RepID=S8AIZ5_DACHA|nr:hypothetical protein H072_3076 [Dactylellina haptotyla CBS 200.50]